jgi:DHA3 family tetracycline resistance protein-like MFS transporter
VVAVLLARHDLRLWELIVMSIVFGTADAFFFPASNAIVPELLEGPLLTQGNALGQMSGQLTQGLIGPAIGGFVVSAIGYAWSFAFDAVSFAVSALCLAAMRIRTPRSENHGTALADALQGIGFVRSHRWLLASLIGAALANFVGMAPMFVLLPLLVRDTLHASPLALGFVYAAGGAAGVVASLVVARLGSPRHRVTVLWISYAAGGVAMALLALAQSAWVVGALNVGCAGLLVYGDVLWFTMLQEHVPREYLGRVSSLVYLMAFSLGPLGILLAGAVAAGIGIRVTLVIGGVVSAALCLIVLFTPGVRDPEREPRVPDGAPD